MKKCIRIREEEKIVVPEQDSLYLHIFTCVCCGKRKGDDHRREPDSEVCLECEQDAGYYYYEDR
jgi:hypothetical protein